MQFVKVLTVDWTGDILYAVSKGIHYKWVNQNAFLPSLEIIYAKTNMITLAHFQDHYIFHSCFVWPLSELKGTRLG